MIKKEVWIHPSHSSQLSSLEKILRVPAGAQTAKGTIGEYAMTGTPNAWTTDLLFKALLSSDAISSERISLDLIEGVDPTLHFTLHQFGDLPVFLTVSGQQIIAEAVLWSIEEVKDQNAFNEAVLRTHKYFPLSTISLDQIAGKKDYYYMFGALSSTSSIENIVAEVETLGSNVIQATEAYAEYISLPVAVS